MRNVFDSIEQLAIHLRTARSNKQTPWKVTIDDVESYTMAGNSDAAIAAVARNRGAKVESVPLYSVLNLLNQTI